MKTWKMRFFGVALILFLLVAAISGQQAANTKVTENSNTDAVIQILEKHIEAIGGREGWKAIKTVEIQSETEVFGGSSKLYRIEDRTTGRFYLLSETPNGQVENGFDGKKAWRKTPSFKGYLPDTDPQSKAATRKQTPLYEYKENNRKFEKLPNETISGKEYLVLKGTDTDPLGREITIKYYFDPTTFLLKQIVRGNDITQTTTFDDYRKVEGKTVAFSTTTVNPQATLKSKVISIKYNTPVDVSKFEYKDDSSKPNGSVATSPNSTLQTSQGSVVTSQTGKNEVLAEAIRIETFEMVWKTIDDSYWDRTFGGVDWQAIHNKYLPLAKTAGRSDEFHRLLNQMVGELHRSHFGIIPPESVVGLHSRTNDSTTGDSKSGSVGVNLGWIDSQLLVLDVKEDSSAYAAGVRAGFVINKIDGKTADEIYADHKQKNPGFQLREEIERVRSALRVLGGKSETSVEVEVLHGKNELLKLNLVRKPQSPSRTLEFQSKLLDRNTGYVKFNIFFGDVLSKFQSALSDFRETKTLIIDLRGNPGGVGQLATSMANLLSRKEGSLGTFTFRYQTQPVSYKGTGEQAYKGQVIVLVNEQSGSTSEVFAGGLQEQGRAVVIGTSTAGAVLPSQIQLLPTGAALQYVVSNFQTPKGIVLEGKGVIPNVIVKTSREALLAGRDNILEQALDVAKKPTANGGVGM